MNLTNGIAYLIDGKIEIDIKGNSGECLRYVAKNKDERWKNILENLFDNFSLKVCGGGINCDVYFSEKMIYIDFYYEIGTTALEGELVSVTNVKYENFPWRFE